MRKEVNRSLQVVRLYGQSLSLKITICIVIHQDQVTPLLAIIIISINSTRALFDPLANHDTISAITWPSASKISKNIKMVLQSAHRRHIHICRSPCVITGPSLTLSKLKNVPSIPRALADLVFLATQRPDLQSPNNHSILRLARLGLVQNFHTIQLPKLTLNHPLAIGAILMHAAVAKTRTRR